MITLLCGRGCFGAHAPLMRLAHALKSPTVHAFGGNEGVECVNPFDIGMAGLIGSSSSYRAIPCQRRPAHPPKGRMPSGLIDVRLEEPGMSVEPYANTNKRPGVIFALGEQPIFHPGDTVRILMRSPIGHYRVPTSLRGKIPGHGNPVSDREELSAFREMLVAIRENVAKLKRQSRSLDETIAAKPTAAFNAR